MPRLKIDGIQVEVEPGATVLDAARAAGADVPTLCYTPETGPLASCMLCVVRDIASGRMLPACSAKAEDGMDIDTRGEEVAAARRQTLLMLLAEHAGDCEAPCSRVCPAGLDIPRLMRLLAAGDTAGAARIARRDLVFPATLGHVCPAPCQNVCRRAQYDSPVEIRACHANFAPIEPSDLPKPSGKRVAVVGAGLAALAAAAVCAGSGHTCHVYDTAQAACADLRERHPELSPGILDAEIASLAQKGVELHLGATVDIKELAAKYDALIAASGVTAPVDPHIFQAPDHNMAVRAVANGKKAARLVDAFLHGRPQPPAQRRFNSALGKLRPEELEAYAVLRKSADPAGEAARCLGCDCRSPVSCKLRRYAEEYGIRGSVDRHMERPAVAPVQQFGPVMFEPGKCIKCGICVELCRSFGNEPGLAFAGRGLATRVELPHGSALSEELAIRCARACPTGALAIHYEETR